MAFESEVDDILRELLRAPGALSAAVAAAGGAAENDGARHIAPLGSGAELVVATAVAPPPELPAAIERAARELRACIRRHGLTEIPEVRLAGRMPRSRTALIAKVTGLLRALAAMHGATAAFLLRGDKILAAAGQVDPQLEAQLAFLRRRLDAEAARGRGRSSHSELATDEVYARSFWFDAYLIVFFPEAGWSLDFVRHRALAVTRLLAVVMPHLEDDPLPPANVRPLPPRR